MRFIYFTLVGLGTLGVLALLGVLLLSSSYDEYQVCTLTFLDIACMIGANATRPLVYLPRTTLSDALP